ncbi:hypothetical protein ACFOLC_15110 [Lysobacter cavernae]|uniref:Uncharacterized protein n=1 Tax=Lysobacter cavernae TaxID=1685901 RepID=A0ABV7RT50_9GAMM
MVDGVLVDDATLATVTGKYLGNDMLVGLRVDLVSHWRGPDGSQASAGGTLQVERTATGFNVQIDSHSDAVAGDPAAATAAANASAVGGDGLAVNGIGQVVQIAGDGNRMSNVASISFRPMAMAGGDFNGAAHSSHSAGATTAVVSFSGGGVQVGVNGPGGFVGQSLNAGGDGGIAQAARIAGNDQVGGNWMHLQMLTTGLPAHCLQQLGVQQALAGMQQLPR